MPITVQPNVIEQTDFSGGWSPNAEQVALEPKYLQDSMNLLIDPVSLSLVTRKGFNDLLAVVGANWWIFQLFDYHGIKTGSPVHYIVAIGVDKNNSGQHGIAFINASTWTIESLNYITCGNIQPHWGFSVQGIWYGGTKGEPVYGYDPAPGVGFYEQIADENLGRLSHTVWSAGFAYKGDEIILKSGSLYRPNRSIRYAEWDNADEYVKGERISKYASSTWKSYRAIKDVPAGTAVTDTTYWKQVKLSNPVAGDSKANADWLKIEQPAQTSVGAWHAERMWLRYDNSGDMSRLQFSAPLKFAPGQDISELEFDPANFAPGNDINGTGGGWINVNDGKTKGQITALYSFGQYLMIFKRQAIWVLSGLSEESFNLRKLSNGQGAISQSAVCEHNGLIYFLDEDGLKVTDGTAVEDVVGLDNVRDYFRTRIDEVLQASYAYPDVTSYGPYIIISLPNGDRDDAETVFYHPETGSFWLTDLDIAAMVVSFEDKSERLYLTTEQEYNEDIESDIGYLYEYTGDVDGSTGTAISWLAKTTWWPFGVAQTQRRIRRIWSLVKGTCDVIITAFRDWDSNDYYTSTTVTNAESHPVHVEGQVGTTPDSHALAIQVQGDAAPASVYGIAVDTEPRRVRYHTP